MFDKKEKLEKCKQSGTITNELRKLFNTDIDYLQKFLSYFSETITEGLLKKNQINSAIDVKTEEFWFTGKPVLSGVDAVERQYLMQYYQDFYQGFTKTFSHLRCHQGFNDLVQTAYYKIQLPELYEKKKKDFYDPNKAKCEEFGEPNCPPLLGLANFETEIADLHHQ